MSKAEAALRRLAGDVAPMLLVAELLDDISRQADKEAEADKAATVLGMLEDRDARLVRQLEEHTAAPEVIRAVAQSLAESRAELRGKSDHERYLGLSEQGRAQLAHLRATGLPEAREALEAAVAELDAAQQELDHCDHKLLSLPTPEAIEELDQAVRAAEETVRPPQIARHKTALHRVELSRPVRLAVNDKLIAEGVRVFDYGCGRGEDLRQLRKRGIECDGWDPVHLPSGPRAAADVVNLGYVVNVIESEDERRDVLSEAWRLANRILVVSELESDCLRQIPCHGIRGCSDRIGR